MFFSPVRKPSRRFMARHPIVGLDIGSSSIKMAEIKPSGKRWRLLRCGIQPLPSEAVVDGQIKQEEVVSQAIQDLLIETGTTTKRTAISLGGPSVITKKIQTISMTELDLEDQIALEAEEYIPFDLEDVHLDFQIMDQNEENMEVLLTACKKDLINSHTEVVRQAGLIPCVCDLDLFSLTNAYQTFIQPFNTPHKEAATFRAFGEKKDGGKDAIVLVNLGSTFLNTAILNHNGTPGYIRDYSFGSRQIIHESQTRYNISLEEARQLTIMAGNATQRLTSNQPAGNKQPSDKTTDSKTIIEPDDFKEEIVYPFLDQLLQQIRQAISFHKTSNPDQAANEVWISGGCALFPDIAPFIGEKLGMPVQIADPFSNLIKTKRTYMGHGKRFSGKTKTTQARHQALSFLAPQFMIALGLALRGDVR